MPLVRRRRNRSPGSTSLRDHYERTAVGLLEALSPISGLIAANHDPGTFIYRGVGSSTYQLVPAAFRGRRLPFPDRRPVSRRTFHNQIWAEIVYFSEYCRVADSRGLRIPEDSQAFRSILQDLNGPDMSTASRRAARYGRPTGFCRRSAWPNIMAYRRVSSTGRVARSSRPISRPPAHCKVQRPLDELQSGRSMSIACCSTRSTSWTCPNPFALLTHPASTFPTFRLSKACSW